MAEGLVPLTILFPLPGLRLGLANLVTVYAPCRLSGREALLILAARCLLGALLGGNLPSVVRCTLPGGAPGQGDPHWGADRLVGAPVFIYLMARKKYGFGGGD